MTPPIILYGVSFCAENGEKDLGKILRRVYSFDEGGTKFIIRSSGFYEFYAFFVPRNIYLFPGKRVISIKGMFYIHSDIVDELLI